MQRRIDDDRSPAAGPHPVLLALLDGSLADLERPLVRADDLGIVRGDAEVVDTAVYLAGSHRGTTMGGIDALNIHAVPEAVETGEASAWWLAGLAALAGGVLVSFRTAFGIA